MNGMQKIVDRIITAVLITVSVLLSVVLAFNLIMIAKSVIGKEKAPSVFGFIPLVVLSGSMTGENADSFNSDDLVMIKHVDADNLKANDVIAFYEGDSIVTHRIVKLETAESGETEFITKGDANDTEDMNRVTKSSVIGIYKAKISGIGGVIEFMQKPVGIIIFIGTPIVIYLVYDTIRRRRESKTRDKENAVLTAELEKLRLQK